MTREVIETAKKEGIPFAIKMDGREYRVDRSEQIHIAKTHETAEEKERIALSYIIFQRT